MIRDEYDELDHDPQVTEDLAYLDALLGPPPPPPVDPELRTRKRFEEIFARATAQADINIAQRRRISRRRAIGMVAAGATTVAAAVTGWMAIELPHRRPAYAATPQPLPISAAPSSTGRTTLAEVAVAAERGGDNRAAVDHVATDRWDLNHIIDGATVTSAVIPYRSELWRAPDDAARTIETFHAPQFPTDADRQAWDDAGSPRGGQQRVDYGAGHYQGAFNSRPPRDPQVLAGWLARGSTGSAAILKGVTDLLLERALTGQERSALLRVLATRTPLVFAGAAVDRAGRTGTAFTAVTNDSGAQVTQVLVIDPRTGRILATETILTAGAPALTVRRPAVISYRTYLIAEHVPAIP